MAGTEPTGLCSPAEHYRLGLPYFLQRFEIADDLSLVATPQEIASAIEAGPQACRLSTDGRALEVVSETGPLRVPLTLDGSQRRELQRLLAAPAPLPAEPEGSWRGLDGRRASVRTIHRD